MTRPGFSRSDKVSVGVGGSIMVPAMIIMMGTIMFPVLDAPATCGCANPHIELLAVPFAAPEGPNGPVNGGGWIVTTTHGYGGTHSDVLEMIYIEVLDPDNRTIERDTRFTPMGAFIGKGLENASWYIPLMSAKAKELEGETSSIEELKALTGVGAVFITTYKFILPGDMFIIFRDIDADGKVDVPDGAQLQVLKHVGGDEEHYSMEYSLGEVALDWPFDMNSLEGGSEVH